MWWAPVGYEELAGRDWIQSETAKYFDQLNKNCGVLFSRPGLVRSPKPNKKFLKVLILVARRVREKKM